MRHSSCATFVALCGLLIVASRAPDASAAKPAGASAKQQAQLAALKAQALKEMSASRIWDALRTSRKAYKLAEKAYGPWAKETGEAGDTVARLESSTGDYAKAFATYQRVAKIHEKVHGLESTQVATALQQMGLMLSVRKDHARARPLLEKSLALQKKIYGEKSQMYATMLQVHASFAGMRHAYGEAEAMYLRAMKILEGLYPKGNPATSGILMSLAWNYWLQGRHDRAQQLFDELLAIYRKSFGAESSSVASTLHMLAGNYQRAGNQKRAKGYYDEAEKIYRKLATDEEKKHGFEHPMAQSHARSLASLLLSRGDLAGAKTLYERIYAAEVKKYGKDSVAISSYHALAQLHMKRKEYPQALAYLKRQMANQQKAWGPIHVAGPLSQMVEIYRAMGEFKKALDIMDRLIKTWTEMMGPNHPLLATERERKAIVYMAAGKPKKALPLLKKAHELIEPHIRLVLATGNEADNRAYMATVEHQLHLAIMLHLGSMKSDAAAAHFALDTVLRRKGRILDAVTDSVAALRRSLSPDDRKVLDELSNARSRLAKLVMAGPKSMKPADFRKELLTLEDLVRKLETRVRSKSAAFRAQTQAVSVGAVAKQLPADGVLVEFVQYRPYQPRAANWVKAPPRYAAYVLSPDGKIPGWVELGAAAPIDEAIGKLRGQLADPDSVDVKELSKRVYTLVMKPLEPFLGKAKRLMLSPDGTLNLLPFSALVDDGGRYLVERYSISYLSSGRELVRFAVKMAPKQTPRVFANPTFDADAKPATKPDATKRGRRSADFGFSAWQPLPGTAHEAKALAAVLKDAVVLTEAKATEGAIKAVRAPRILHIATHGYFLPSQPAPAQAQPSTEVAMDAMAVTARAGQAAPQKVAGENPLLRSGLIFANANQLRSGQDDGVLTALEAAGLDLWGTRLVVLSACETGVGEVTMGDGVHGLRRALVIAGAESLIMSLWQVDDEATRRMMSRYYQALDSEVGRSEALRRVQLRMLRNPEYQHPYFWAAFIAAGKWGPLEPKKR